MASASGVFGFSFRGVSEGKFMTHGVFTIVTEVLDGHEPALREELNRIQSDQSASGVIPFPAFKGLHFSSLTLFPPYQDVPSQRWLLVFEHAVDGHWRAHVDDLIAKAEAGLRSIYRHCCGFRPDATPDALRRYLHDHAKQPHLHHIGTPHRYASTILADLHLRDAAERRADAFSPEEAARHPAKIWQDLWHYVRRPDHGGRLTIPQPEPRAWTRLVNWSVAVLIAIAALALVAGGIWLLWPSPVRLSLSLVVLFLAFGMWTALLLGWPVFPRDRDPDSGRSPGETRRIARSDWRTTINTWLWFALVGWGVSLIPGAFRLAGVHTSHPMLAAVLLAVVTIVALVFMVGQWSLPTPELARPRPTPAALRNVKAQEDVRVINHMSAMVRLRPGRLRRVALRLVLLGLEKTWFHTWLADVGKGRLFNFSTVHFAQWVVLDGDRYLFLSNYDHSFSRYLDDFGNISFGLARLWGMGAKTPGLSSLERFKDFARTWMTPYSVWYAAYPDAAVTQIWNNEALRRGLAAAPSSVDYQEMLQRLVNARER
jgi:hypothetical protein